jgi:hypothetical protein
MPHPKTTTTRNAFIFAFTIIPEVRRHWENKFPGELYTKVGPCVLGDNRVPVEAGETAIEVFSPAAHKFMADGFANGIEHRLVSVDWNAS